MLPASIRLNRLRKVLDRANVSYAHDGPEAALCMLPILDRPARLPRKQLQKFRFPLAMPARVAMFEGGFLVDGAIRQFAAREAEQLHEYVPEALVLPLQVALMLADQKQRQMLDLPTLTAAVVILTSLDDTPLAENHRTLLWRAFGVPLFEQLQGWDGAVIARECEVHDGLHVDETAVIFESDGKELIATQLTAMEDPILRVRTGVSGTILNQHCECGAETPRLRNLVALHSKVRTAVA